MPEIDNQIKSKISNPAKILRGYMDATGITDAKTLSDALGIAIRTIQRLKLECATCANDAIYGAANDAKRARYGVSETPNAPDMALADAPSARADITTRATKELPSEVSLTNELTDSREREVSQSVELPPAELKQAFNGSTENLLSDIQRWMSADRHHAVKWLTTLLSIAGSDAVLAAYGQLLESQTKGKLIADPIRYLGKTAPTLKGRASAGNKSADVLPFKVSVAMHPNARPRDEVMGAANA